MAGVRAASSSSSSSPSSSSSARGSASSALAAPGGVRRPRWLILSTLLASVAGLGVSIYLTVAHYTTTVSLSCPETATINCEKVTTSPESFFLGIPVAVLGLAYFVVMLGLNSPWAWRSTLAPVHWVRVLASAGGMCFVGWLVYAELFKVDAICLWCTSVHVINFILFCLIAVGTAMTSTAGQDTGRVSA